jgi:hypothetical protein
MKYSVIIPAIVVTIIGVYLHSISPCKNDKPISLPEEIQAVQPNDTLIVSKVSDSIYIEFK